jgi:hypothetical protein
VDHQRPIILHTTLHDATRLFIFEPRSEMEQAFIVVPSDLRNPFFDARKTALISQAISKRSNYDLGRF